MACVRALASQAQATWASSTLGHLESGLRTIRTTARIERSKVLSPERLKVKAEVKDFGKLAGTIVAVVKSGRGAEVDAVGDTALSNAVKAVSLANIFGQQDGLPGVSFVPQMVAEKLEGEAEERRFMRLKVQALHGVSPKEAIENFNHGGIFVNASAGKTDNSASKPSDPQTPTAIAKTIMGHWLNYSDPGRRAPEGAAATPRRRAPFVVTMSPLALSRAVKALAFVCKDLSAGHAHLAGVPPPIVWPRVFERRGVKNEKEKVEILTALVLVRPQET